ELRRHQSGSGGRSAAGSDSTDLLTGSGVAPTGTIRAVPVFREETLSAAKRTPIGPMIPRATPSHAEAPAWIRIAPQAAPQNDHHATTSSATTTRALPKNDTSEHRLIGRDVRRCLLGCWGVLREGQENVCRAGPGQVEPRRHDSKWFSKRCDHVRTEHL